MAFDWIFGLPPAEPPYALDYHAVPDQGVTEANLETRHAKEQQGGRICTASSRA